MEINNTILLPLGFISNTLNFFGRVNGLPSDHMILIFSLLLSQKESGGHPIQFIMYPVLEKINAQFFWAILPES